LKLIFSLLALSCYFSVAGQGNTPTEEEHARLLTGKKKCLIVYAGRDHSFTMEPAAPAKPSDVPDFITIGKQIVQATLVPADRNIDLSRMSPAREKEVLLKYMDFELAYYRKKLRQRYTHLQTEWISLQGRTFLLWYFDMPENQKLVRRQVYVSTLFFDRVVDLNAPVFKDDDWGKARELLVRLAGTMKTYDKRLDIAELGRKLNKG
jgi:hypothetical protein